jgi:hypothetical protein
MAAIEPMYAELSWRFAVLEAGAMSQLLEETAPEYAIGLCQIGLLDFDRVLPLLALDESCRPVHCLLGGAIDPDPQPASVTQAARLRVASDETEQREEGEV